MNKIVKRSIKKFYEIPGEAIDVKKFLSELTNKYINFDHKLICNVKNNITTVMMNRSYIESIMRNILTTLYDNIPNNIPSIFIYRNDKNLNILISAKFIHFVGNLDINYLLINFIMELHNGNYKTKYSANKFNILMSFPDYRIIN